MPGETLAKIGLGLWDNYEHKKDEWSLYVHDIEHPVGILKSEIAKVINWPDEFFQEDTKHKNVSLKAEVDAKQGFIELCRQNESTEYFAGCQKWLEKLEKGEPKLDYHPIFVPGGKEENKTARLMVPSPIRGILGILTAGVHVNVYTTKGGNIDKIWLSKRSETSGSYRGCWDQIIAGGMEPVHNLDSWANVKQETKEETNYYVGNNKELYPNNDDNNKGSIGNMEQASVIWFWTDKIDETSHRTAKAEMYHTEPGVRFCFDVEIPEGEIPKLNSEDKSSSAFMSLTVEKVKHELKAKNWKPNCGLVMLDFLSRKGLLSGEEQEEMQKLYRPRFNLPIPDPFQRLNDEVNAKNIR